MGLTDAAKRAREAADASCEPGEVALADALQGVIDAETWRLDRSLDPHPPTDDVPPWSAVRPEGESEGPIPF